MSAHRNRAGFVTPACVYYAVDYPTQPSPRKYIRQIIYELANTVASFMHSGKIAGANLALSILDCDRFEIAEVYLRIF